MKSLRIYTELEHLATLTWEDGVLSAQDVHPDFTSAIERWSKNGILDWIPNESGFSDPRRTMANDSLFLPRLRDYISRQFSRVSLELIDE